MSIAASVSNSANLESLRPLRELYFELGRALLAHNRYTDAVQAFEQALKEEGASPGRDVVLFNLAVACEQGSQPDRAFRSYLEAIAVAPQRMAEILPYVHKLLTPELAIAEGEWLDSQWKTRIRTEDLTPGLRADLARFLGRVSLYRSDFAGAAKLFGEALAISGDDPRLLEGLGETHWRIHNVQEALEFLTRAHEMAGKGDHRERLMAIDAKLAQVLVEAGEYQLALERIAESLAKGDRFADELLLSRSQCYLALAQPDKALEAAEAAQQRAPASVEARILRTQALIALGRCPDALQVIDEALQNDPQRPDLLLYKAQALLEGQIEVRQGRQLLTRYAKRAGADAVSPKTLPFALTARKSDGKALYFVAELYRAVDHPDEALKMVDQALAIGMGAEADYREAPAQQLKGELLEQSGQKDQAATFLYEAGRRFLWRNDYETAVEQLRRSIELDPKRQATYWYCADALRMLSYQTTLRPEDKKAAAEESARLWDKGTDLGLPDQRNSWAYMVRALVSEQLASLAATDPQQQRTWWWEGTAFLERALLLYEPDADAWAALGRDHRFLMNEANALQATARGLELVPDSLAVLDERAAILANVGEFDAAEEVVDKRRAAAASVWADGVKAYILSEKRQYKEALDLIRQVVQAEPENLWDLDLRARCFRMLGDKEHAEQDYRAIWNRYDAKAFESQITFGTAAYYLGDIERAIEIFSAYPGASDDLAANWYLGACYLSQNKLPDGERHLARSVALVKNARELDDTLREDLPGLNASSEAWPHREQVREILGRIRQQLEARQVELKAVRPPENELKEILDKLALKNEPEAWPWISVYAALGRLHTKAELYADAAAAYRMLLKHREKIPEVVIGIQQVAAGFEAAGDRLLKSSDLAGAIQQYRNGLDILSDIASEGMARQASLRGSLGLAFFLNSDLDNARSEFSKTLQIRRQLGSDSPGQVLGQICRQLLNDPKQYWALEDEWNALAGAANQDEVLKSDLMAARKSLAAFVVNWLERPVRSSPELLVPMVTPIVMEIGAGLVPADTSENWSLLKTYIPQMRERIENQIGVRLPGVRVRGSNVMSRDGYALLLYEQSVAGGNTYLQMRYCPAAPGVLQALGIPNAALKSAENPLTGEHGSWVPKEHWDVIQSDGLELWEEPLVFIIHHLEAVLRQNLADFLGVQEVENLLEGWAKSEADSALILKVLPDEQAHVRFARLLRALVREQVPITAWREILGSAQASGLENLEGAVRAVRLQLKEQLPGNDSRTRRYELPAEWKHAPESWLKPRGAGNVFAPSAEQTHGFLVMLAGLLPTGETKAALVVDSPESRPYVRRLVEPRFPRLMLLSREELLAQNEAVFSAA